MGTRITFIGTGAVRPPVTGESASLLINTNMLIDVGWCNVLHMRTLGLDPMGVDHLFFTHFHHDHYLGLPQLLFFLGSKAERPLTVLGPAEDLDQVVELALRFLQTDRFPGILPEIKRVPLQPGDTYETSTHRVTTARSLHPVPALAYRFDEKGTDLSFTYTGDTGYNPDLVPFAKGSQVLIHEASYGDRTPLPNDPLGHASGEDAGRIAALAQVPRLYLVHCPVEKQQAAVDSARRHHSQVTFPQEGDTVELRSLDA